MKDLTNLDVTIHSKEALDLFNAAITELCFFKNPLHNIIDLLKIEPDCAMGQVLNAHVNLWTTDKDDAIWSVRSNEAIHKLDHTSLTTRERMHIAAVQAWVAGDLRKTSVILDEILIEYPCDILALLSGHQIDFFLGEAMNLRDRVSRVLPSWDSSHPLYGFLLGMLSFGQEESGHYKQAEETGLRAVELNPTDVWGIHAVSHALEMQNKPEAGEKFMHDNEQYWGQDNFFIAHNAIHYGLFLLETNNMTTLINVYDKYVHNKDTKPACLTLVDASSVMWRLYLEGVDTGNRIPQLAQSWQDKCGQNYYAFNDVHAMIAFAASGDHVSAKKLIKSMEDYLNAGDRTSSNYLTTQRIGLPVAKAFYEFSQGHYSSAIDILMPIKNSINVFGGSHAQRDVVARTLLDSAIKAKQKKLAKALINERIIKNPDGFYNQIKLEQVNGI
ncbi:tetratricopeptide repeat protein [Aliamphritea ceti]|uniref:tetratricopeptide repeat protein n=1 Tax=Aliamphritea ceti TaxID=1524258 RepID=UPI0021C42851|nr:tetratricopeptide repeat protein [Aliamphritea ceti]